MSLTDTQIFDLAKRMNIPLVFCSFKDELLNKSTTKLQYNKAYIINLENEFDEDGNRNSGSHYCAFQCNKTKSGNIEPIYFDPFGIGPPEVVKTFVGYKMPYNTKDIQSIVNNACGWYCLAFLYYINTYENRKHNIYLDAEDFTDLFLDLSKSTEHLYNEFVLKNFFRSKSEELRKPIEVGNGMDYKKITTNVNSIDGEDDD